jgi:hypothetical protein
MLWIAKHGNTLRRHDQILQMTHGILSWPYPWMGSIYSWKICTNGPHGPPTF